MALSSTIYKVELQVSDLDRHFYKTYSLTVAQHPSETDERVMIRLLVFALNAQNSDQDLEFTKGISTDEEPDLWRRTLTGDIDLWIELGQPSAKRIKKACSRANKVKVYTFSGHGADIWWQKIKIELTRFKNLEVINFETKQTAPIVKNLSRTMNLQATIQDGLVWFGDQASTSEITPEQWMTDQE